VHKNNQNREKLLLCSGFFPTFENEGRSCVASVSLVRYVSSFEVDD